MKRNFHYAILIAALTVLTGCATAKYTLDQTFGGQREEPGEYKPEVRTQPHHPDLLLANADDWIKKHLW
jgi:hypothetical protein